MEFFDKIVNILRKPFPEEESTLGYVRVITMISVFVILFLYTFQPFGISTIESGMFLICLGFGSMTFLASIIYEFVISRLFNLKGEREHFTFGRWILNVLGLMLCISLANFLFARSLFGNIRWEFLPQMIYGTFAIGIFPVVVLGAISLIRQENRYQIISEEINQKKGRASSVSNLNDLSVFDIPASQIRYMEALQNYVKIGYVNSEGQLKEQTERVTLKSILDEVEGSSIVKCHRSFLVNREAIIATSGNAQGLLLTLSDCDKIIPVSRSCVVVFREN
ncbi:MAG: hypothetical protein DHS20C18_41880 [Saprospiraceae bacterium]|nr:MAG: hypothetical protein DHS20C18_41880 [Saprospiraceae bacterium]